MDMRWNLDSLYTSFESKEYENDLKELDTRIDELNNWTEVKLKNSLVKELDSGEADVRIREYLDSFIHISKLYSGLFSYAELIFSVDASDTAAKRYAEIMERKLPEINRSAVVFARWISEIDSLDSILINSGLLKDHRFYLIEKIQNSSYLLSDDEELLAAKLKNTGSSAWSQLWNTLTSTVKVAMEVDGEEKELPLPVVRNMAYSGEKAVRERAFRAEIAAYKKIEEAAAASLNGVKGEVITMAETRGYDSPLAMTLKNSRMDLETLETMFTAVKEYLPVFRKYFRKKAEFLGHGNGLPFYDLFAPVGKGEMRFTYDEARDFIVQNFREFSNSLADYADNAFEKNWIDAEQREGKRGGAFCENLHIIGESRIMVNFDGSFSSVTTLAHELGHGYHGLCLKNESFLNSDYPMPLAETASIFCETLILQAALKKATKEQALTILENSIQSDAQVIVDIYSRYLFESELFAKRKRSSLSVEELKDIMSKAQKDAYGNGLDNNVLHPYMWACKPHYYYADYNFYNFPYTFGLLFAKGLYGEYIKTGNAFIEKYDSFLKETGKNTVRKVTAMMGIDVSAPGFWRNSLDVVKEDIEKFLDTV